MDEYRGTGRTTRQLKNLLNNIRLGKNCIYLCNTQAEARYITIMFVDLINSERLFYHQVLCKFFFSDKGSVEFLGIDLVDDKRFRGRLIKNGYLDVDHNTRVTPSINEILFAMQKGRYK